MKDERGWYLVLTRGDITPNIFNFDGATIHFPKKNYKNKTKSVNKKLHLQLKSISSKVVKWCDVYSSGFY